MKKAKIGVITLGCRVNQYESDAISEGLVKKGYTVVNADSDCDAYIINTCTVTEKSDSKSRYTIRRALESGVPVVAIGCYVQGEKGADTLLDKVTYVSGNRNKGEVVEAIEKILSGQRQDRRCGMSDAEYEPLSIDSCRYVKAYVKIEDGCNNFCTYCYVPYVRGRVRSRGEDDIIAEVGRLKSAGYRELILTGIETSAYGEDMGLPDALCSLTERIQRECHIERLRFGSLNPIFFTQEHIKRLYEAGVMPHFHMSVQSASTEVLERMHRKYNNGDLYRAVETVRKYFDNSNLSCDMICGFPGETEENFKDSLDFITKAEILHAHIFPYSEREGTAAAKMNGALPVRVRNERAAIMKRTAEESHKRIFMSNIGKEYNVLVEFFKGGVAYGYTENYIPLQMKRTSDMKKGDVIKLALTENMYK